MSFNLESFKKRFLEEARENIETLTKGIVLLESEPQNSDLVKELNRVAHTLKGSLKMMGYEEASKIVHEVESSLADVFSERVEIDGEKITELLHKVETIKGIIFGKEEEEEDKKEDKKEEKTQSKGLKRKKVKRDEKKKDIQKTKKTVQKQSSISPILNYVRIKYRDIVEFSTLLEDSFYNASALLSLLEKNENTEIAKEIVERIKSSLAIFLANLRNYQLIPLSLIFDILPKTVRNLSMELKKEIILKINGGNIKVEKKVFDSLSTILIHILRNSVDHGIEKPEERLEKGKERKGKIKIEAYLKKGKIFIEISDDGRGINWKKLKEKAVSLGLMKKGKKASKDELKSFLFYSGFSTKDDITEISGRGVGLDVVYETVKKLNGNIELKSKDGKGTTIILSFPQILSLVESLIFNLGGKYFAIPVSNIEKILRKDKVKILNKNNNAYMYFFDGIIPVININQILNIESSQSEFIIIVSEGEEKYGILVDQIIRLEELILSEKEKILEKYYHILGTSFSEVGEIITVLDPVNLIKFSKVKTVSMEEFSFKRIKLLIVEDSELTREIIYDSLIQFNYEIEQASNGLEALEKIEYFKPDIILSDIDMPKMDGIKIFKNLKSRGFNIPVIFLSSHEEEDKIKYVKSIGAATFLKKSEFSPEYVSDLIKKEIFNG